MAVAAIRAKTRMAVIHCVESPLFWAFVTAPGTVTFVVCALVAMLGAFVFVFESLASVAGALVLVAAFVLVFVFVLAVFVLAFVLCLPMSEACRSFGCGAGLNAGMLSLAGSLMQTHAFLYPRQ